MFRDELAGGPKRELRNARVIEAVLAEPSRLDELFECVLDADEYVRMRAADALEKLCRREPSLVARFVGRILREVALIDQPSVQWHVAQILGQVPLTRAERSSAARILRRYLEVSNDWIVLGCSMDTLAELAASDPRLRHEIQPRLEELCADPRKAVANRAARVRERLAGSAADRPPRRGTSTARPTLGVDPVPPLLHCGNPAIGAWARRDLLDEASVDVTELWALPEARRLVDRQQPDGRWRYPSPKASVRSVDNYDQLETYRQLSILVHRFGVDRRHGAVDAARRFLATFQTTDGDYRGIYGNQLTPNYSAAITEVLIHAGYASHPQVQAAMRWLLAMRQDDGGWAIPARTRGARLDVIPSAATTIEPDRAKPSSHLVTGIVLRAFAADPAHRHRAAVHDAARWLATRPFTRDHYPDRAAPANWTAFSFPFWWTDALSVLDTLSLLGWAIDDPAVSTLVDWFVAAQNPAGGWNAGRNRPKGLHSDQWVALAAARALRRVGVTW